MKQMLCTERQVELCVDSYQVVEPPADLAAPKSRFRFQRPWRKVAFFLWHEGWRLTWRKVLASRVAQQVEAQRQLYVIQGHAPLRPNLSLVAVGPQSMSGLDHMYFPESLVWEQEDAKQVEPFESAGLSAQAYQELFHHDVRSGLALSVVARQAAAALAQAFAAQALAPATPTSNVSKPKPAVRRRRRVRSGRYPLVQIGAGAYPTAYVLPNLKSARPEVLVDTNPAALEQLRYRGNFRWGFTDIAPALDAIATLHEPLVVIASYHDSHTPLAAQVLEAAPGARVMVEKPPVVSYPQVCQLQTLMQGEHRVHLGFNRRYAPMTQQAARCLQQMQGPITLLCSVKELQLPEHHWYFWPSQGTRVVGNLCHWLDLACRFIDAPLADLQLHGSVIDSSEEISLVGCYADGSQLTLVASDRGDGLRGVQEYLELRRDETTIEIDDYMRLVVRSSGHSWTHRTRLRDKGHERMYQQLETMHLAGEPAMESGDAMARLADVYLRCAEQMKVLHNAS